VRHEPNIEGRAVKQRLADWLAHANGCRRRAHEYRRWALEYETAGNLEKYRHYHKQSDRQWLMALDAMIHARRDFDFIKGARKWH
jgi:hypothetical protein